MVDCFWREEASLPLMTSQALLVKADPGSFRAQLTAWEAVEGHWQCVFLPMAATIGRNGLVAAAAKTEGDGSTPCGIYALGEVFGSNPSVITAMPYRQATKEDFWVDDPASPQYNRWVQGIPEAASWECMLRPDGLYRYGIVVKYNTMPVIAGRGSAIFIHLWRGPEEPTQGCVALAEADLLRIIAWLEPEKKPVIVLGQPA